MLRRDPLAKQPQFLALRGFFWCHEIERVSAHIDFEIKGRAEPLLGQFIFDQHRLSCVIAAGCTVRHDEFGNILIAVPTRAGSRPGGAKKVPGDAGRLRRGLIEWDRVERTISSGEGLGI